MRKKFFRVLSVLLIAIFGITCTGCGADPGSMTVPLIGSKVLYRPNTYDYDDNDIVGEGNSEYFAQYAWRILYGLYYIYGITDQRAFDYYDVLIDTQNIPYVYDSIRYQIVSEEIVTSDEDGSTSAIYTADTQYRWNWSFDDDAEPTGYINDPAGYSESSSKVDTKIITTYLSSDSYINNIDDYYHAQNLVSQYAQTYLGVASEDDLTTNEEDVGKKPYTDYVRGLEYIMYCLGLELDPTNDITVGSVKEDGTYQLLVTSSTLGLTRASIDFALNTVKEVYQERGTIVGLDKEKQDFLINYILNNVIGNRARSRDYMTKTENGVSQTIQMHRDYDNVVKNIVNLVCSDVHIGSQSGGSPSLDNPFLSAEIRDYERNAFFFNATAEKGHEFDHIPAREYQSIVMMFSQEFSFANLWLYFKYDGNDPDVVEEGNSLKINIYLNFHAKNTNYTLPCYFGSSPQPYPIEIPDGAFRINKNTHTAHFDGFKCEGNSTLGVSVGKFTEIEDLKCKFADPASTTYNRISEPIVLSGTNNARNYYTRKHSASNLGESYFSYGVLDPTAFAGVCDYFEIAFEIVKDPKEVHKNYNFQVAIALMG